MNSRKIVQYGLEYGRAFDLKFHLFFRNRVNKTQFPGVKEKSRILLQLFPNTRAKGVSDAIAVKNVPHNGMPAPGEMNPDLVSSSCTRTGDNSRMAPQTLQDSDFRLGRSAVTSNGKAFPIRTASRNRPIEHLMFGARMASYNSQILLMNLPL